MRRVLCALGLILMCGAGEARADLILTNMQGGWTNPQPGGLATIINAAGQGTDIVTWGDTINFSGFAFTPGSSITSVPFGVPLALGTFGHGNFPTPQGTGITGIDYLFSLDTNGTPGTLTFTLHFALDETLNEEPCPFPGASICDDRITVSTPLFNSLLTVGGQLYYFNLLGFSRDGGATISTVYQTAEGGFSPPTILYAVVTSEPLPGEVPEPASGLLLGLGVAGIAAVRRMRRTQPDSVSLESGASRRLNP